LWESPWKMWENVGKSGKMSENVGKWEESTGYVLVA
jgi:hypothetical protein